MDRYTPPLALYVSPESIPGNFGVFENGLDVIFSQLYLREMRVDQSKLGRDVFYRFVLISNTRLALSLPGSDDFALVFNPGFVLGGTTEFPAHFRDKWALQRSLRGFNLSSFDFSPDAFYNLLLSFAGVSTFDLFFELMQLNNLEDDLRDPFADFVSAFNAEYNPPSPLTVPTGFDSQQLILDSINHRCAV